MKYVKTVAAIAVFIVLLLVVYIAYIKLFEVNVVFYSSIYSAIIATAIFAGFVFVLPYFRVFSTLEKVQTIAVCFLLGYIYAISVPTVIDRSLSFYILEKIQQRGGGIQEDKINYVFTNEYVKEHHLMAIRLTEQLQSGTIVIQDGCVKLTPWGDKLATLSLLFRENMLPKRRLLLGQYTDALNNPFKHSEATPDYTCH
ncbi:hypothetical protein [Paraburkholderia sp. JHI869]|uniref:hypothetical protein n=1 Tax=Paraburkholderia sp. JHI869 TaxID=3112959 RepID=UPI00316E1322